jgi:pimeloyl-ACP methyl ester carboxylesterase
MRIVFVHGACVKDGSWWWHRAGELLAEQGLASGAPALPSCGETGEPTDAGGPGLAEDVAAVRHVLTASDEPTVVVAHSYGGIVTAEAAAGVEAVRHLLLVSSYLPEVGQSLSSFGGDEPAPFLDIDPEGGTFTVRPDALAETFLQDCDAEIHAGRPRKPMAWARSETATLFADFTSGSVAYEQEIVEILGVEEDDLVAEAACVVRIGDLPPCSVASGRSPESRVPEGPLRARHGC